MEAELDDSIETLHPIGNVPSVHFIDPQTGEKIQDVTETITAERFLQAFSSAVKAKPDGAKAGFLSALFIKERNTHFPEF